MKRYIGFVLLAMATHLAWGDNLFVAASGGIYKFDTTVGAASQSPFNSQSIPPTGYLDSLAVDTNGNVLAGYYNSNNRYGFIDEFAPNGSGGLYNSGALFAFGLALDSGGDLFMDGESYPNQTAVIYKFTPTLSGPVETTFASGGGLSVGGLAFDSNGTLWMANGGYGSIIKFGPNGSHATFVTLPGGSAYPRGVAFDSKNNLWVTDYGAGKVYEFTNNTGTLSSALNTFATIPSPYGLVFDSKGDLFVAGNADGNIYEYINSGGSLLPTPTIFASGLGGPTALAIGLAPAVSSPPSLAISLTGGSVIVSWTVPATGYVLQTNTDLETGNWGDYGGVVTNNTVTTALPQGNLFFRLSHP